MPKTLIILFIVTFFFSCVGHDNYVNDRIKIAEKFLDCLKNNTPDQILEYTEQGVTDRIDVKESRDFNVNKAHKFITKFGLPSKDKWIIKDDPNNNLWRLIITVPIFKGHDSESNLLKADIVLFFPPYEYGDKISRYEIADEYALKPTKPLQNGGIDTTQ